MKTCAFSLLLILSGPCAALEPSVTKLFSTRTDGDFSDDSFGVALDGSDRWLVAGEPGNGEKGAGAGAAYVFDAATGALRRKLLAPDGAANHRFGLAVAVSGNRVVVGAPGRAGDVGAAYVFDATTGKLLVQLLQPLASTGDLFGSAVAVEGDMVVVGAPGDDSGLGSLFLFDIKGLKGPVVGQASNKIVAAPRAAGVGFGGNVVTDGRIIAAAASFEAAGNGAVYWFDGVSRAQLQRVSGSGGENLGTALAIGGSTLYAGAPGFSGGVGLVKSFDLQTGSGVGNISNPTGGSGGDFGFRLAVAGGLLVVGRPEETAGAEGEVWLYDLNRGPLGKLEAPDGTIDDKLGGSVAIAGNGVVASADPGGNALLYRFHPVAVPIPNNQLLLAKQKDFAPGAGTGTFSRFDSVILGNDDDEEILIQGAAGNGVTGVWGFEPTALTPTFLSTTDLAALGGAAFFPRSFGVPMWNNETAALLPCMLKGAGVTAASDQALLSYNPNGILIFRNIVLREGQTLNTGMMTGTRTLAAMKQVVQSEDFTTGQFGVAAGFKTGVNGVSATNDSGALVFDKNAAVLGASLENTVSPAGPSLGQISPRVALNKNRMLYHARLQSTATPQGLFLFAPSPGGLHGTLALVGTSMSIGGGIISSIVGETISPDDNPMAKLSLTGAGITSLNNEVLVFFPAAVVRVMSEGDTATDLSSGVVIARFLRFWSLDGGQYAAQVVVRGTGVTASNDQALILANESGGGLLCLLREGDIAPGCDSSRIGVIQGIEMDPDTGEYAVLASLAGAASGRDQALFTGSTTQASLAQARLRKPWLNLRKGQLIRGSLGSVSTLKSIALGVRSTDATGASGKGLPTALQGGELGLKLTFTDGAVHAVAWEMP